MFLLIVTAIPARASLLECTNPEGDLHYKVWSYSGGIAPRPGTEVRHETWTYKNVIIGETVYFVGGPPSVKQALDVKFNNTTKTIIDRIENPDIHSSTTVYSILVTLNMITNPLGVSTYSSYIICRDINPGAIP